MTDNNDKNNDKKNGKKAQPQSEPDAAMPESTVDEDYKEKMLRIAAEFDNYKKRVKSDIDNAKNTGKAELVKSILPVLDEFEIAMMSISTSTDKNLIKGTEMVYSNFVDTLKKAGLSELSTDGVFDPYKHEIVLAKEGSKKPQGTILEVTKKGYAFAGILIRPASVIIAKESTEEKSEDDDNIETK